MREGDLFLASDGSTKGGDKSACSTCLSSHGMKSFFMASHEVIGGPSDSGRAGLYGVVLLIEFVCGLEPADMRPTIE